MLQQFLCLRQVQVESFHPTQYVRDIAEEYKIEVIDIHSLTANARELFSFDGVHPNAEGARVIANAVFEALV